MVLRVLALLLTALCAQAATEHPAAAAGIYETNIKVKGTAGRKVTLNLAQDGKASLRSEMVGKDVVTNAGTWSATGDEVRVEFDGNNPPPMAWKLKKGRLTPTEKSGLTLRRPR
jgi:hypothetical protein